MPESHSKSVALPNCSCHLKRHFYHFADCLLFVTLVTSTITRAKGIGSTQNHRPPVPFQWHVATIKYGTGQKITASVLAISAINEASIFVPHTGRDQQWSEGCEPLSVFNLCDFCRNSKRYQKHQDRFRKPQVSGSNPDAGLKSRRNHAFLRGYFTRPCE